MRERLAVAAYNAEPMAKRWDQLSPYARGRWLNTIDAILDALMEPSEGMLGAGVRRWRDFGDIEPRPTEAGAIFQAMLKAAKEDRA